MKDFGHPKTIYMITVRPGDEYLLSDQRCVKMMNVRESEEGM